MVIWTRILAILIPIIVSSCKNHISIVPSDMNSICDSGKYFFQGACTNVGTGYFSTGDGVKKSCTNKPLHSIYTNLTSSSAICPWTCDSGFVSNDGSTCTAVTSPVVLKCAAGEIMVGISGRAGALIDVVNIHCAPFSNGTFNGPPVVVTGIGNLGGSLFNDDGFYNCPANSYLTTVEAMSYDYWTGERTLNLIRYTCTDIATEVESALIPDAIGWGDLTAGGGGSDPITSQFKCGSTINPHGKYMTGITTELLTNPFSGAVLGISCI